MEVTRHLRVFGLVQGVGLRDALRAEAERLGVRGWVRNRRDGSVEAVTQGPQEAVDALIAWARRGPPAARVSQLNVQPAATEIDRIYADFDRLPTV